ncbi:hypothetical protein P9112_005399 [Eukaryota sp. TZLM1-RC]
MSSCNDLEDCLDQITLSVQNDSTLSFDIPPQYYNKTIAVLTYGCAHNQADSELIMGVLSAAGFNVLDINPKTNYSDAFAADCVVVNGCVVVDVSENSFFRAVREAKERHQPVVVAGCVAQTNHKDPRLSHTCNIGTDGQVEVANAVVAAMEGREFKVTKRRSKKSVLEALDTCGNPLSLPSRRRNPFIEILPICQGCLSHCTYCKTRLARGGLVSFPKKSIISRVVDACLRGAVEIYLTGEDTFCYGKDFDFEYDIVDLLLELLDSIKNFNCRIRIGHSNPQHVLPLISKIKSTGLFKHPNLFRFLHLPLQSGSQSVLIDMKRDHDVTMWKDAALALTEEGVSITTDIIVGYPTETRRDHLDTLSVLDSIKPTMTNLTQFFPRPGTPAAKLKRVPADEVKRRSKEIHNWLTLLDPFSKYLNTCISCFVYGKAHDGVKTACHSIEFIQVLVEGNYEPGQKLIVLITDCSRWHLKGRVVENS